LLGTSTTGCYLASLGAGQARLLRARRPIPEVLVDPTTPDETRTRLALVPPVLDFARGIGLDAGGRYTTYAAWPDDRIVTNIVATRPGSTRPAESWFPIVGRVPYRGYFDRADAEREAARLLDDGLDVCVLAVPAYSTLGWLDDPVTEPMLRRDDLTLVDTLLHELLHHTVFVRGDARFDEGLATWVGQTGAIAFFAARDGAASESAALARAHAADERALARALAALRAQVDALYASAPAGPARDAARAALEDDARRALAALPLARADAASLAARLRLNDACLAASATYGDDLEALDAAAERLGGLAALIAEARRAADAPDPRRALLDPARPPERAASPRSSRRAVSGFLPRRGDGPQDRLPRRR